MAATYPATNLQLQYNSDNDEWSFNEVAYDYPTGQVPSWQGYTTPDISFPEDDDGGGGNGDDDRDPCPPGYTYDETLKQCIPDANYQAPAYAGEPGSEERVDTGSPLTIWVPPVQNPDGSWTDGYHKQMPNTMAQFDAQDLFDWGLSKGYIDAQGNIIGPMQATAPGWLGTIGQAGNQRQFNNWLRFYQQESGVENISGMAGKVIPGKVSVPLATQIANIPGVAPAGYMHERWIQYVNTVDLPRVTPQDVGAPSADIFSQRGLRASDVSSYRTFEDQEAELEQERKQELHEEKLEQARLDTSVKKAKAEREMKEIIGRAEKQQDFRDQTSRYEQEKERQQQQERTEKRQEQKEAGTGGSFGREDTRPVSRPEPQKKERKTGQGGAPIWRL